MSSKRSSSTHRNSDTRQRRLVIIRIGVIVGIVAAILVAIALVRFFSRPADPASLKLQTAQQLSSGNLDEAERTIRTLEKEVGLNNDVRTLKSELLTAEALESINTPSTPTPKPVEPAPMPVSPVRSPAPQPSTEPPPALPGTQALRKLGEAMAMLEMAIADDAPDDKWHTLLRFNEAKLRLSPTFATAGTAAKLAERRLLRQPSDIDALRLRRAAINIGPEGPDQWTAESQKHLWLADFKTINDPAFTLPLLAHGLIIHGTKLRPEEFKQAIAFCQSFLTDRITAFPNDQRWLYCRDWLQTAAMTDSKEFERSLPAAVEGFNRAMTEDSSKEWLKAACMAHAMLDRRPVVVNGIVTTRGKRTVAEALRFVGSYRTQPTFLLFFAETIAAEDAVVVYESILSARPPQTTSPDDIIDIWQDQELTQNGLIRKRLALALRDGVQSEALTAAKELRSTLDTESLGTDSWYIDATLAMAEGNFYAAAASFRSHSNNGRSPQALGGQAEALLRAGEWGEGLRLATAAFKVDRISAENARLVTLSAQALTHLHAYDQATTLLDQFEAEVGALPEFASLRKDIEFQRLLSSSPMNAAEIEKRTNAIIARYGGPNGAALLKIKTMIEKGQSAAAAEELGKMDISSDTLNLWNLLIRQSPEYLPTFLNQYDQLLLPLTSSSLKDLLRTWHQTAQLNFLIASGGLLDAARQSDPVTRTAQAIVLGSRIGIPQAQLNNWIHELPEAQQNSTYMLLQRLSNAVSAGDWTGAEDISNTIRHIKGMGLHANLIDAQVALSQGKTSQAVIAAGSVIAEWPFHSTAYFILAMAQRAGGNTAEAITSLETALTIKPDHAVALAALFSLYNQAGQNDKAKNVLQTYMSLYPSRGAVELFTQQLRDGDEQVTTAMQIREVIAAKQPHDVENKLALAALYERNKAVQKAEDCLRRLMISERGGVRPTTLLAALMVRQGRATEAAGLISTLEKEKCTAFDWLALADYYRAVGDARETDIAARKALAADPEDRQNVAPTVGSWLFQERRYAEALPLLEKVWSSRKTPAIGIMVAECALNTGNIDKAKTTIAAIEAEAPDWHELPLLKAALAQSQNDREGAFRHIAEAIRRWPNDADNYITKARLHRLAAEVPEALENYRQALAVAPMHATARLEIGEVLLAAGRTDEAMAAMSGQGTADIRHPIYQAYQATLLARNGQYDLALQQLLAAREAYPDHKLVLDALMKVYETIGDFPHAAECAQRLLTTQPGNSLIGRNNLAYYLAMSGKTEQALPLSNAVVAESDSTPDIPPAYRANFWDTLGVCKMCAGDTTGARTALEKAASILPLSDIILHLAQAQLATGDAVGAANTLQPALKRMQAPTAPGAPAAYLPEFRVAALEVLVRTDSREEAAAHASDLLADDLDIGGNTELKARLIALVAYSAFRKAPDASRRATVLKLNQSLALTETIQALTLLEIVDQDNAKLAKNRILEFLDKHPNAYLLQYWLATRPK